MEGSRFEASQLLHGLHGNLRALPPTGGLDSQGRRNCAIFEVSDDGRWVAECCGGDPVVLRSGLTHEAVRVLEARGPLAELSFSPRGRFLLTVCRFEPLVARIWEVDTGRLLTTWADRTEIVLSDWLGDTAGIVTREGLQLQRMHGA